MNINKTVILFLVMLISLSFFIVNSMVNAGVSIKSQGSPQGLERAPGQLKKISESLAPGNIDSCGELSTPGTYYLEMDIINSTATTCMDITSTNVTLDCQDHIIDGNGTPMTNGVYYYPGAEINSYHTIKNCVFTDWGWGINFGNSKYNNFTNIIANSNYFWAIYLENSDYNQLTNITANYNNLDAITLGIFSSYNQLRYITSNFNRKGVFLYNGHDNQLTNITANYNNDVGIALSSNDNNQLTNITANYNNDRGISLSGSNYNTITYSVVFSNSIGILLASSSHTNPIQFSKIFDNTNYNLYNDQPDSITAGYNWWGTTDCSQIDAKIYDYNDDNTKGIVDYEPFLDAANPPWIPMNCVVTTTTTPTTNPPHRGGGDTPMFDMI